MSITERKELIENLKALAERYDNDGRIESAKNCYRKIVELQEVS